MCKNNTVYSVAIAKLPHCLNMEPKTGIFMDELWGVYFDFLYISNQDILGLHQIRLI